MQVSYQWLLDNCAYEGSFADFCDTLSLTGTKVEAGFEAFKDITGVKTGKIVKIDKDDNPDIQQYRGYADWRARWDSGDNWIVTLLVRRGTAYKGSVQLDLARRGRDLKIGPVSGYFHVQYFNGYGEDILDYNVKRKSQIRIGFAIVP